MCVTAVLLLLVCVCLKEQTVDSCSCFPAHPQQLFCSADVVMKVEITGKKTLYRDENLPGMGTIQYEVQVNKVFKGSERTKEIQHVYTNEMSSLCGIRLNHGHYLLSGSFMSAGFFVTLCDYFEPWDKLSLTQKKNLKYRFQKGCNCTISICTDQPCHPNTKRECVLTEWSSLWMYDSGEAAHEHACVQHSDGSCGWFGGTAKPSENDTLDTST